MTARERYEPTLDSLRRHAVPEWYHDAKLGIFIHWSISSVPAFAPRDADIHEILRTSYEDAQACSPYAEWYENSLRFPWSPVAQHHRATYGDKPYAAFQAEFEAGLAAWQPDEWADAFARAGARYVVLVTKHHDGYCLWPSAVSNPHRSGWQAPRDVVGDLAAAVRARGMRFGTYYSGGIDWTFDATPLRTLGDVVVATPRGDYPVYAEAQVRELIARVHPDVLWNDIAWPTGLPALLRLFADYYNTIPEGVLNDRWMTPNWLTSVLRVRPLRRMFDLAVKRAIRRTGTDLTPPRPAHCDVRTPEYAAYPAARRTKWECVRGIDKSFGYNRNSREEDFLPRRELIWSLVDIVAKNGNLLLNVGPRGDDAGIPEVQVRRLEWLRSFLQRSGEAIYGTRPWTRAEGRTDQDVGVRFTQRGGTLYAILLGSPRGRVITLKDLPVPAPARVDLLGAGPVPVEASGEDLRIGLPDALPDEPAHAFAIRSQP